LTDNSPRVKPESKIVNAVKGSYEAEGYVVATERPLGYGRADLVAYRVDASKCDARCLNGQYRSLERIEHYTVLRHLPEVGEGPGISIEHLCEKLGRSPAFVRSTLLNFLERSGYVAKVGKTGFARVNGFIPIASEIIAVEAKVSDWRKGAIQAKRYRWFADRVYLAISARYEHRVQRDVLQKHSIGLLSVEKNSVIELLSSPTLAPHDPDRHSFAAEWLWRYKRKAVLEAANRASEN
jgi:hypothetical protein